MKRTIVSLTFLVFTACLPAAFATDPINPDRLIYGGTWNGKVGVEGGIPNYTSKYGSTINAYSGSPSTIADALDTASDNQYVELGAGTFNLNDSLIIYNSKVVLRGQVDANGVPTTILNFTNGSDRLVLIRSGTGWDISDTNSFTTRTVTSPSGSSLRGASTVTLASTPTGMTVGQVIFFSDNSQDGFYFYGFGGVDGQRSWMHWARCTAISNSVVSFTPAISADFLTGVLQCHYKAGGGMIQLTGVENIEVRQTTNVNASFLGLQGADSCWFKNVVVNTTSGQAQRHHLDAYSHFRCEVNHCEMYGQDAYGNSSYVINARAGGAFLVINNYFHDIANVMPMFSLHCSAFAYNYINALSYNPTGVLSQIVFDHGAFNDYNLFEGNWCAKSYNDDDAASRNNVWLRNRMRGYDTDGETGPTGSARQAFAQETGHLYRVLVGNVLGEYAVHNTRLHTFSSGEDNTDLVIYNLHDDTTASFVAKANFNSVDDGIHASEALGGGEEVAVSYLFPSKPTWFGNRPWPWCDPGNPSQSNNRLNLPAAYRAAYGVDPPMPVVGVTYGYHGYEGDYAIVWITKDTAQDLRVWLEIGYQANYPDDFDIPEGLTLDNVPEWDWIIGYIDMSSVEEEVVLWIPIVDDSEVEGTEGLRIGLIQDPAYEIDETYPSINLMVFDND
jgi:hypothetical protein